MSEKDLILFIFEKGKEQGMDESELIVTVLIESGTSTGNILNGLDLTASPELKEYLHNLSELPESAVELYRQLLTVSQGNEGFGKEDINQAFRKYLENRELIDFIGSMKKFAEGDLLNVLKELDPFAENIRNREDLISYLLKLSETRNYTPDDVYRLAAMADKDLYFNDLIERMIELATGGLKQALIDLKKSGKIITDTDQLIDYLMENRQKYGYTTTDIFELLKLAGEKITLSHISSIDKDSVDQKNKLKKGAVKTFIILLLEGFIILILILLAKRKRKEK